MHKSNLKPFARSPRSRAQLRTISDLKHPAYLPVLGNALQLPAGSAHLVLENWFERFGSVYAYRTGPIQGIAVGDLSMARAIAQQRPNNFRRMGAIERTFEELGFNGVFSAEGDNWRRLRRLMMPSFRAKNVQSFQPIVARITGNLLERCRCAADTGEPIDIHQLMMQFSVDVTTEISFGYPLNTLQGRNSDFQKHMSRLCPGLSRRIGAPFAYWRIAKLPIDRALDRSMHFLIDLVRDIVQKTQQQVADEPSLAEHPQNLLQTLLQITEPGYDQPLSEQEVVANVMTLLLAGEDTTANGLAWAIHHLALDPRVQTKAAQEAQTSLKGQAVHDSYEAASEQKYLGAVMDEVLRRHSPAPLLYLEANQETVVNNLVIPKGTVIALMTRYLGLRPDLFSEPQLFFPERWLNETTPPEAQNWNHSPHALLAFGSGPRVCPGRSLARLETQLVLSSLLNRYEMEHVIPPEQVKESFNFTMSPRNLSVRLRHRSPLRLGLKAQDHSERRVSAGAR